MTKLLSMIIIASEHWAQMQADVASRFPEEACGLVAGAGNRSSLVIPVTNTLHDPHRFRLDPQEELNAFLLAEEKGWEILAVYHSHPHGIFRPSPTDFAELAFSEIIYLIWYQEADQWCCLPYLMHPPANADEIALIISTKE